ncbi:conjugal transfer protein TraH [Janthinobacterium sp. NKUCC06_STL]|uniref:conjugal transfer protein TraH n=1 Tax=Janthinobacterium sp. NKUCC06_STL TaxID=2842127 RepID=UPI001C5AA0ED|nr:conjugal transfer protein TraH [Janthinobacterium sp. NKUCC06_STL]MBW3510585.1 conjugal transfer protein TraH [Janthinobacterium sp. NKUCC06_STL]
MPMRKLIIALSLSTSTLYTHPAFAGDLNAEVNKMFNDLGAIGNYSAPGAFRGQVYNTYSGGSLMLRAPNKTYQLMAINYPTAKAGCGGIDLFGGSFSYISAAEFKNMLKNVTSALPGVAFQLALESVSPLLGGITKWTKNLESMMTNAQINSCNTAKSLVSSAAEATGFSSSKACEDIAVSLGLESDYAAAAVRCKSDKGSILDTARKSSDPLVKNKAPFVGNLTWESLKLAGNYLDDKEREMVMSMVGTVIFYPEGRDDNPIAPTFTSISQLLYGQSDAGGGNVHQTVLRCNNFTTCDQVTVDPAYVHTPFTAKVEKLMRSIAYKIETRTPIPNMSPEVGFVNQTSEPVYRMLSIGASFPSATANEQLIATYRDVIAADYAYMFLEKNLRLGMGALEKDFTLNTQQKIRAQEIRLRAKDMLAQLSREKALVYQKVGSITVVSNHLEQLSRQMRANIPQQVLDLLGRQAAYLR